MNSKLLIGVILAATTLSETSLAGPQSAIMFDIFDTDKNQKLSMAEYRNGGMDAEGMNWAQGLSSVCTEHTLKTAEPELIESFRMLDSDKDKTISREEFITNGERVYEEYWSASFKQADSNKDKALSKSEYKSQAQSYVQQLRNAYTSDKIPTECRADVEYWSTYYEGLEKYIDQSFYYLDLNSNNSLTYAEYKGTHLWQQGNVNQ